MEWLINTWNACKEWIISGGVTVILTAIGAGLMKGIGEKAITKIDVKSMIDKIKSNTINQIENVTFTHDIAPLVKKEFKEYDTTFANIIKTQYATIKVIEAFADYFNDSVGVSDDKKEAFNKALEEAKKVVALPAEPVEVKIVVEKQKVEEEVKPQEKQEVVR